jgi:DNA-binding MarR family transcriptional regulator
MNAIAMRKQTSSEIVAGKVVSDAEKKKRRMKHARRWALFNRLIELDQRSLKDSEFRVLMTLFRHQHNGVTDMSQVEIARQTGKTREAVSRAVRSLVKKELVVVLLRSKRLGSERTTNKYHVQ